MDDRQPLYPWLIIYTTFFWVLPAYIADHQRTWSPKDLDERFRVRNARAGLQGGPEGSELVEAEAWRAARPVSPVSTEYLAFTLECAA
jgi:hypothetical protein